MEIRLEPLAEHVIVITGVHDRGIDSAAVTLHLGRRSLRHRREASRTSTEPPARAD